MIIGHFKYLLLLSSQALVCVALITDCFLLLPVHGCKPHGSWHKYVVIIILIGHIHYSAVSLSAGHVASIWRLHVRRVHEVIMMLSQVLIELLEVLELLWLRVFIAVVGHVAPVSTGWTSDCSFLVVTVEVLDV